MRISCFLSFVIIGGAGSRVGRLCLEMRHNELLSMELILSTNHSVISRLPTKVSVMYDGRGGITTTVSPGGWGQGADTLPASSQSGNKTNKTSSSWPYFLSPDYPRVVSLKRNLPFGCSEEMIFCHSTGGRGQDSVHLPWFMLLSHLVPDTIND